MKTLLVVDDQDIFRDPLCQALRTRGFRVLEASDGQAALVHTERHRPDLALIDLRMPGMDGIDLIRSLRAVAATTAMPVILLTAQARREDIAMGSSLGIRDFLLKASFSMNDLVDRIESRLAAGIPSPPPPPASFQAQSPAPRAAGFASRLGSSTTSVPPSSAASGLSESGARSRPGLPEATEAKALPTPVAEILAIASSSTASLAQVQKVVRRDPILAERVMTFASGVGIKGSSTIETLEDALRVMGLEQLVKIVASTPVFGAEELAGRNGQELVQIWTHGLATAVLAERIAPARERLASFLDGLFHVLPALIGVQSLAEDWSTIASGARREGRSGIDALALAFGQPTGPFAEGILSSMRLPEAIASVVREWHRDRFRRGSKSASERCRRVDAAASLASGIGFGWDDLSCVRPISAEESRTWSDPDGLPDEIPALRKDILKLQSSAGLPPAPDVSVLAGLWGSEQTLYWRDARFRSPDPVEIALSGRELRRLESPERILQDNRPMAIACAEPGSPWWTALLGSREPLVVVHCGPAPASVRDTLRLLQAPVPLYLLHEAVGDA